MGRQRVVDKPFPKGVTPQQAGYTPIISLGRGEGRFLLGYFRGVPAFIDLDKLVVQPLAAVEGIYSLDKIDERDAVTAKIANGATKGAKVTAQITVPAGEVWFLNRATLVSPAATAGHGEVVLVNFRISSWKFPDTRAGTEVNENGRAYLAEDLGTTAEDTKTIDFPAQGELGEELRLVGGGVITLTAELTVENASGDLTASLTPYGRKGKALVS